MRTDEEILKDYSNVDVNKLMLEVLLDIRCFVEDISEV